MRWTMVVLALVTGCAGAQLTAETARVVACTEAGEEIVSRAESGDLEVAHAQCMLEARDLVCDKLHEVITEAD